MLFAVDALFESIGVCAVQLDSFTFLLVGFIDDHIPILTTRYSVKEPLSFDSLTLKIYALKQEFWGLWKSYDSVTISFRPSFCFKFYSLRFNDSKEVL